VGADLTWQRTGLYPILDLNYCERNLIDIPTLLKMWEEFPDLIDCIQLRAKSYSRKELISVYESIQEHTKLPIILNDYWELAIELKAYGFHLGKEDFIAASDSDKIKIQSAEMIKGTSSHSIDDLRNLEKGLWNYTGFGPIFHTGTKKSAYKPLGTAMLRDAIDNYPIPIVPIGGINSVNFWSVVYGRECKPASISLFSDDLIFPLIAREYREKLSLTGKS
jgi:thiamine-phosphate pyrophosphorylase